MISIITINYNNSLGLKRTLDSVAVQTYCDFEHIIIDGGSTDDSVTQIQEYIKTLQKNNPLLTPKVFWSSEADKGIYDAMNKGIDKARGEYCLFLNSGDMLANLHVLEEVFLSGMKASIICCNSIYLSSIYHKQKLVESPSRIIASDLILSFLPHQSSFIKKELFNKIHKYDTEFKIISDWLFFIEALLSYNESYQHIPIVVSHCETEGISNNPQNCNLMDEEFNKGLRKIMPLFADDYIELKNLRKEVSSPFYNFVKRIKNSLWFRIIWKVYKIKDKYSK